MEQYWMAEALALQGEVERLRTEVDRLKRDLSHERTQAMIRSHHGTWVGGFKRIKDG